MIRICAEREDDLLRLTVWDNGNGMPAETINEINEALEKGERGSSESYGIYNVNERIRLYYGENYGLFYMGEENKYTCAVVTLPIREEHQEVEKLV